jgi:hypothetical protein
MNLHYAEKFSQWVNAISPRPFRMFSLWLKQSSGYYVPPGLWFTLTVLAALLATYALLVACRSGSVFRPSCIDRATDGEK